MYEFKAKNLHKISRYTKLWPLSLSLLYISFLFSISCFLYLSVYLFSPLTSVKNMGIHDHPFGPQHQDLT